VGGGQGDGHEEYALMLVKDMEMYSSCCHYIFYMQPLMWFVHYVVSLSLRLFR